MSIETKHAEVVRALAEAMALSPELIAESPADYVHQLKQQLAAARAARDTVARSYLAASRGEEAARQRLADAEKRGAVKALRAEAERLHASVGRNRLAEGEAMLDLADRIESGEVTP